MDEDNNIVRLAELKRDAASEDSLALVFAAEHASDLRYVAKWDRWLGWDGTRWAPDDTLHTFDRVRDLCRDAATRASAKAVAAVERLARSDRRLAATTSQWDAAPWLLTDTQATHDLLTGISREPDRLDYLTKQATCAAAPIGTAHPRWSAFLDRVTAGNAELQRFLQRYIGYCCTGVTDEHVFVFAYGTGANGKGTFINTIAKLLGDYAAIADMNTFLASNVERHPTDLAKLHGARLVIAQETHKGRRWDEPKIKALTGGDTMTARFMRRDYFDFTPTFKLFIAGNHRPRLSNVDEAMRRRLLLVPFTVQIPPAERDTDLPRKLQAEGPAILRWCLDGCFQWQQAGLDPPAIVRDATDAYFADEDTVHQWLEDCTADGGQFAFTRIAELFASWKQWCDARNTKPGSARALSEALADHGLVRGRDKDGHRGFRNLTIR